MTSSILTRPLTEPASRLRVIDCDVHPVPRDRGEIGRYLPRAWQEHWRVYGHRLRQPFLDSMPYPKAAPALSRRDAWPPGGGPPGSDLDFVRALRIPAKSAADSDVMSAGHSN